LLSIIRRREHVSSGRGRWEEPLRFSKIPQRWFTGAIQGAAINGEAVLAKCPKLSAVTSVQSPTNKHHYMCHSVSAAGRGAGHASQIVMAADTNGSRMKNFARDSLPFKISQLTSGASFCNKNIGIASASLLHG